MQVSPNTQQTISKWKFWFTEMHSNATLIHGLTYRSCTCPPSLTSMPLVSLCLTRAPLMKPLAVQKPNSTLSKPRISPSFFHLPSVIWQHAMQNCLKLSGRYAWCRPTMCSKNATLTSISATSFYASRHNKFADKVLTPVPKKPFKQLRIGSFLVMRSIVVLSELSFICQGN